jgi:UDP-N-acetyl-D-mannosaminuronic acid dehydrogenase
LLVKAGAVVSAFEPFKPDFPLSGVRMSNSLEEATKEANLIVLLVGHSQFKALDPKIVAKLTSARLVVDTVNGWNNPAWQEAGFKVIKLGKGQK